MKFYAVKNGRSIGIYNNWSDCEKQVKGFPSASYKAFSNLDDAKEFLLNEPNKKEISLSESENNIAVAYVDGSYDKEIKVYGYGSIIFYNGKKHIINGNGNESGLVELRNVAGELIASIKTIEYAIERKINELHINYDYLGIEKWFTGEWKSNTDLTRKYREYAENVKNKINIKFIKVKSHSGNKYNDEVDSIARNSIYEKINISDKRIEEIKIGIKESKVKNGKIEPIFNIRKNGQNFDTDIIMLKFKELWKYEKRKLNEIDKLSIEVDIDKEEVIFNINENNKITSRRFNLIEKVWM